MELLMVFLVNGYWFVLVVFYNDLYLISIVL